MDTINFKIRAILGKPGTGKTSLIQKKIEENPKYCFLTATTGQAAYNLASNIQKSINTPCTIHSALGVKDSDTLVNKVINKSINNIYRAIANETSFLLIDEIPLINSKFYTALCQSLNSYNADPSNKTLNLLIVGDFGQLPCVSGKPIIYSPYWQYTKIIKLTKIWRQTNPELIRALDLLRENQAHHTECVDWVQDNIGFEEDIYTNFQGMTIFTKNIDVDKYNKTKLNELPYGGVTYKQKIVGAPPNMTKYITEELYLKEGALVIIQVNNFNKGYVNGSLATVYKLHKDKIEVLLNRNGKKITLGYHCYENIDPKNQKVLGSISQIPVRLAWASTLHKIQGATLDSIQIKLGNKGDFFSRLHAGLATAMSRCTTEKGIRLIGNKEQFIESNYIDPKYKLYM